MRKAIVLIAVVMFMTTGVFGDEMGISDNPVINFSDFVNVSLNWHQASTDGFGDYIKDGYVDIQDLMFIADNWLQQPGTQYIVNSLEDTVVEDGVITLREAINAASRNEISGGCSRRIK